MIRLGAIDPPPKTPTILGFECAGEVEAIGEGVEDFAVSVHNNTPLFHKILIKKCFDIINRLVIVLLLCLNSVLGLSYVLFQRNMSINCQMNYHSKMLLP